MSEKKLPSKSGDKITKKTFDLSSFKKERGLVSKVKTKELTWIPLSKAFHDAVTLPGMPRGFFTLFRGYSNTGKSTAIYEAVVGAQKIGDLPIIYETEGNWNWEHAKLIGVEFEEVIDENTGEIIDYTGDFILIRGGDLLEMYGDYDYSSSKKGTKKLRNEPVIEDIGRSVDEFLEFQQEGSLPRNLCFLWDSIGSLNCFKSATSKSSNNMWNAGAMESTFKSIWNFKIPDSQIEGREFTNSFGAVQKIWLDNENKVIKHKGGEAGYYGCRLIIHYGGILTHSSSKLTASALGRDYQFGIETKIRVEKNQVNGIETKGVIASTPHGYINPSEIDKYKKENKNFILEKMGVKYEDNINIEIVKEEIELSKEDKNS